MVMIVVMCTSMMAKIMLILTTIAMLIWRRHEMVTKLLMRHDASCDGADASHDMGDDYVEP